MADGWGCPAGIYKVNYGREWTMEYCVIEMNLLIMSKNRELLVFCRLSSSHEMLQYSSTLPSPTTATVRVKQVSIVSLEQATLSEIVLVLFSVELWSTATSLPSVTVALEPFQKHWTVALLFST